MAQHDYIFSSFSGEGTEAYRDVKQLAQGYKRSLEYDLRTFKYIANGLRGLIAENYNFGEVQAHQQRSDWGNVQECLSKARGRAAQ